MKSCPSCKRAYHDETLRFCLDDGALLASGPDSEATMIVSPPPVLSLPATTAWQSPSQATQPAPASRNPALTYAVVALVALLALLVGGGIVFLLRPPGKASSDESHASSANVSPSPARLDNKPAGPAQSFADNRSSSLSNYDTLEAALVRGERISRSDLSAMSQMELRRLRNAVFARHGRMFNTPELQRYFDSRPWYTRRFDYSDRDLTATDKANLNLIVINEGGVP